MMLCSANARAETNEPILLEFTQNLYFRPEFRIGAWKIILKTLKNQSLFWPTFQIMLNVLGSSIDFFKPGLCAPLLRT